MKDQTTIEKQPMPLADFMEKLKHLAKTNQWDRFRLAVKKRSEWFEKYGNGQKF